MNFAKSLRKPFSIKHLHGEVKFLKLNFLVKLSFYILCQVFTSKPYSLLMDRYHLEQCSLLIGAGLKPEDKIVIQKNWALPFSFSFPSIMNKAEIEIGQIGKL